MKNKLNRREFLGKSITATVAMAASGSAIAGQNQDNPKEKKSNENCKRTS